MKPSIPKGTRDFLPSEVYKRNFIFETIRSVFKKYGYQPIETPTMENLTTLTGKYGEEGDKLLFKVLNNDMFMEMAMAIDKLDKIGKEKVIIEMTSRGIPQAAAEGVLDLLNIETLPDLEKAFQNAPTGLKGIEELKEFHAYLDLTSTSNKIKFDISLARGLNYYTGCIFEVEADTEAYPNLRMGSIAGGGRYDNLTEVFGLSGVSGVGVSFGAERIYDVMEEEKLFPEGVEKDLDVLLIAFDDASHKYAFKAVQQLRDSNIIADLYPAPTKMKKQMKYANARQVPFVILIGSNEMESGVLTLKNMTTGEQFNLTIEAIIEKLFTR
ncbi:unnamed protein product [Cyprideis torosa]|uniref:histidine--tRNA ligase n=1 Tax=Cyprideis torosa TaxID=163714 RepID=A0A7R8WRU2_9CRUS|nr:unnamed protein product [Cyprideis torosa]CAG0908943.1 unnamed protein product [Cyprideis torosa]